MKQNIDIVTGLTNGLCGENCPHLKLTPAKRKGKCLKYNIADLDWAQIIGPRMWFRCDACKADFPGED